MISNSTLMFLLASGYLLTKALPQVLGEGNPEGGATLNGLRLATKAPPALLARGGAGDSVGSVISGDGQWVAFSSAADNLVPNEIPAGILQVFLRSRQEGKTLLVSMGLDGQGAAATALVGAITADGGSVAFESAAGNLVEKDTNGRTDVFVRHVGEMRTELISVNAAGSDSGEGESAFVEMTPDGRFILFQSAAADLTEGDKNGVADLFVRDRVMGLTSLVTVNTNGQSSGHAGTNEFLASISDDGRFVSFQSSARDLAPLADDRVELRPFVRDLSENVTLLGTTNVGFVRQFVLARERPALVMNGISRYERLDLRTGERVVAASPRLLLPLLSCSPDGSAILFTDTVGLVFLWRPDSGEVNEFELRTESELMAGPEAGFVGNGGEPLLLLSAPRFGIPFPPDFQVASLRLYRRDAAAGVFEKLSAGGDSAHDVRDISMNGGAVIYSAFDNGETPNDFNRAWDVFVWDESRQEVELISERAEGSASRTASGSSSHGSAFLDESRSSLVFASDANNLVPGDENSLADVFVRDLGSGEVTLASAGREALGLAAEPIHFATLSVSGRWIAFVATVEEFGGVGLISGIFVWDRQTGETARIDAPTAPQEAGARFGLPAFSPDENTIAYLYSAVAGPELTHLYLWDRESRESVQISAGPVLDAPSLVISGASWRGAPSFSSDGRQLGFLSADELVAVGADLASGDLREINLSGAGVVFESPVFSSDGRWGFAVSASDAESPPRISFKDLSSGTEGLVCESCQGPSTSAEGRWVAYERLEASAQAGGIGVLDRSSGEEVFRVETVVPEGKSPWPLEKPRISLDGRYIVFETRAGLLPEDANGLHDVYLADRVSGNLMLVSRTQAGRSGNLPSVVASVSPLRDAIVVRSFATDLAVGDMNSSADLFLFELYSGDSDLDGMPDDWEVAYFDGLSRSGRGDFDGDGVADAAEFRAGTDPTDSGSIFKAFILKGANGGSAELLWFGVPGKRYQVEYKDEVNAAVWTALGEPVIALEGTVSATDGSWPRGQRFYRVVLLP